MQVMVKDQVKFLDQGVFCSFVQLHRSVRDCMELWFDV